MVVSIAMCDEAMMLVALLTLPVLLTLFIVTRKVPPRRKVRVLVDMDGVLCDFEAHALKRYQDLYPGEPVIPIPRRRMFKVASQYGKEFGQHTRERIVDIIHSEGFFENLPPIPGCVEAIKTIALLPNVELFFCSSPLTRYEYVVTEKFRWIEKHFGTDWTKRIILTKDKTVVKGTILIDDNPVIVGDERQPEWEHVIFTATCNANIPHPRRILSWDTDDWVCGIGDLVGVDVGES